VISGFHFSDSWLNQQTPGSDIKRTTVKILRLFELPVPLPLYAVATPANSPATAMENCPSGGDERNEGGRVGGKMSRYSRYQHVQHTQSSESSKRGCSTIVFPGRD